MPIKVATECRLYTYLSIVTRLLVYRERFGVVHSARVQNRQEIQTRHYKCTLQGAWKISVAWNETFYKPGYKYEFLVLYAPDCNRVLGLGRQKCAKSCKITSKAFPHRRKLSRECVSWHGLNFKHRYLVYQQLYSTSVILPISFQLLKQLESCIVISQSKRYLDKPLPVRSQREIIVITPFTESR